MVAVGLLVMVPGKPQLLLISSVVALLTKVIASVASLSVAKKSRATALMLAGLSSTVQSSAFEKRANSARHRLVELNDSTLPINVNVTSVV